MESKELIASIMFVDIVGYSKITEDLLKQEFQNKFNEIINSVFTPHNHFYQNTWGDAVFICSYGCLELAESALKLRDQIRTTNWKKIGIINELKIRIGLHTQKIILRYENEKVTRVTGKGIDLTARIEPIVESNHVYCTSRFYEHLQDEDHLNISGVALGKKKLAKDYGEMDLFDLSWENEQSIVEKTEDNISIPIPKIRKEFTDKEKQDFLDTSYNLIANYFDKAAEQLSKSDNRVEVNFQKVSDIIFTLHIYVDGSEKSKCKIWLTQGGFMSNSIAYSEGFTKVFNETSMNDNVTIEDDGFELSLRVLGFGLFGDQGMQRKEKLSPTEVAEYFWKRVISKLEH